MHIDHSNSRTLRYCLVSTKQLDNVFPLEEVMIISLKDNYCHDNVY